MYVCMYCLLDLYSNLPQRAPQVNAENTWVTNVSYSWVITIKTYTSETGHLWKKTEANSELTESEALGGAFKFSFLPLSLS